MKAYQTKQDVAREIEREIIADLRKKYGNEGYQQFMRDPKNRTKLCHRARAVADLEFARLSGHPNSAIL